MQTTGGLFRVHLFILIMEAIIKFNLPEEEYDYKMAVHSAELAFFIHNFENYLRSNYKWGDPPDDIEKIYDTWFELKPKLDEL